MTPIAPDAERLIALLAERAVAAEAWTEADWTQLIALARQHNVAPVVYARLKARGLLLSRAAAEQLRRLYLASAAGNVRLFRELGAILRALHAAGIPVIPLKGACLAEAVYGNVALRPMNDLDLLVKPHDMARALEVLRGLGYSSGQPCDPAAWQAVSHHMPPLSRRGGVKVEMHWTIVPPRYLSRFNTDDLNQLWSDAVPATIAGASVLTFAPADLVLHLCLHASVHHHFDGAGLRNYLDIAQVCRRYADTIDWERFTARANRCGFANGVHVALQLAAEWARAAIPASVPTALTAAPLDAATASWIRRKILHGASPALRTGGARLLGATRVYRTLGVLRDLIFPSSAELAQRYRASADSWRVLGYYPVHIKTLWARHRRTLWHVVRRDRAFMTEARQEGRLRAYLG